MVPGLVKYLEVISANLRLHPVRQRQIIREMYTHLEERVDDLEARGLTHDQAVDQATAGFGQPRAVARELYEVHSDRNWLSASLAAAPYVGVSLLFALGLSTSLTWLAVFLSASVGMTLLGWWRGKPQWMYPWAGFSLVLPLVSGLIAGAAVGQAGWQVLHGREPTLPYWVVLGLLTYMPFSIWMLVSVLVKVIRFDWIFASLMLLPFPILVRWILSLQFEGSALAYERGIIAPGADLNIALVFLALSILPVLVLRLDRRSLKIAALLVATPPSFIAAAYNLPGHFELPGVLLFAVLSVLLLLAPGFLDTKVGRSSAGFRRDLTRLTESAITES